MRTFLSSQLLGTPVEEESGDARPATEREIARAAMVLSFGPRTAGWLVARHRRALHASGSVDFVVPARPSEVLAERLRWFFIAMDYLRGHRPGWRVDVSTSRGRRTFRVTWLSRGFWKRARPS